MFGLLSLDKPPGITSRDVVNRVARLVRPAKAGHAGTLDPLATGVLIVCVGPATRLIAEVQQLPKQYVGTFLLGQSSASDDTETEITHHSVAEPPSLADLESAVSQFTGQIMQLPPSYSALKVAGRRAYALARQGIAPTLAPRPVEIHSLRILDYAYPRLTLDITCGSGTYVRAIGRDLASAVGTHAVMSALRRTAIGPFQADSALSAEGLTAERVAAALESPLRALGEMPRLQLSEPQLEPLRQGRSLLCDEAAPGICALIDPKGELAGLGEVDAAGLVRPQRMFLGAR